MVWTKEKPVRPGWYWTRDLDFPRKIRVVEIFANSRDYLFVSCTADDQDYDLNSWPPSEWAGPIPEPEAK